jgi:hypothetical protein
MISKSLQTALNKELNKINKDPKFKDLEDNSKEILAAKNVLKNNPTAFEFTNTTDTIILQLAKLG